MTATEQSAGREHQPPTGYVATPETPGADVLADAVRRLVDACVRTQVEQAAVLDAASQVDALTERLSGSLRTGAFAPDFGDLFRNAHSIVTGDNNPLAPPVRLEITPERAVGTFTVGSAYEGPPGFVHGGVLALVLDHVLGQAALAAGYGGMTVNLELRYVAPSPLHTELVVEGWLDRVEGRKVHIAGSVRAGDTVTVQASGLFLLLDPSRAASYFPHLARG